MTKPTNENTISMTEDALLDGRLAIRQPAQGYRVAIDPVLLAAAVPARAGQTVLEAGTGVGTALLCLGSRVTGLRLSGLEREASLAELARENARLNGIDAEIVEGNLAAPPQDLKPAGFDHVMMNPPYLQAAHGHPPADPLKRGSTREGGATLHDWIAFAYLMLKRKGSLTLIHRADRLNGVLAELAGSFGDTAVFPLWPKDAARNADMKAAKRVIIRTRKGVASPLKLLPGLVLHEFGGAYTAAADAILRQGHGLDF